MSEDPRPGTVGSLDRRVERLETGFADLASDMRLIKQEQAHSRELMDQHFRTIEQSIQTTLSETRLVGQRFETAMAAGIAAAAEPSATPAGRSIIERVSAIERDKETEHGDFGRRFIVLEDRTVGLERRVYMAVGATALALLFIQLIVPFLMRQF